MGESLATVAPREQSARRERANLENLDLLTFTGLDYKTPLLEILQIWRRYPRVEFGVLLGSRAGQDTDRRYPDLKEVKFWRGMSRKGEDKLAIAIHLCGRFARAALGAEGDMDEVLELCQGFGRVQINAGTYDDAAVAAFAERVGCRRVILQQRQPLPLGWVLPDPKVEYLFDVSGGRGRESFEDWPSPSPGQVRSGYAGGLNPANISTALDFVASKPERRFWLDMESGVRTANDWLNIGQVKAICEVVFPDN